MHFVQKRYFAHHYLNYGKTEEQELCSLKTHKVVQKFSHTMKNDKDKGIKRHKRPQGLSLGKKQQSKKTTFVCVCVLGGTFKLLMQEVGGKLKRHCNMLLF